MHEHGTKSILIYFSADGVAFWLLLPSSVSLISGGTMQPENTYSCILKVTGQVWESQKRISINTNHSYHIWCNNKGRFSINQPNRKRWCVKLVDVKHLSCKTSFIVTPLLEGWPTKAKEAPSIHEVRLAPLDTNLVFQSLGGNSLLVIF